MSRVTVLSVWGSGMQAQQFHISMAQQRGKEGEGRLAGVTLERAKGQQQLQECQATIRDLTAQLQQADSAVADKLPVSCACTCCLGLLPGLDISARVKAEVLVLAFSVVPCSYRIFAGCAFVQYNI